MATTLEIKYFNSFWLKKIETIVNVKNTTGKLTEDVTAQTTIVLNTYNIDINVGQALSWESGTLPNILPNVLYVQYDEIGNTTTIELDQTVTIPKMNIDDSSYPNILYFGPISDFSHVQAHYGASTSDWFVEESRIRGGYDNTDVDLGVKAYIVEVSTSQQYLPNSLIYSGIFNSRTGINSTNQFSVAEDITRSVDPSDGSIQKLYAEDTNLIIFQEQKVSRALIDKDAIYSAEGQPMTTSGSAVIGQIQQYAGNYGIGTNPESFAVYGYRKYFADKNQNVVLRLSQDGITEISAYGMIDFFRDNLSIIGETGKIIGSWDMHNKQYVVSLQPANNTDFKTLTFDEDVNGWTSFFSFKPELAGSLLNNYYTFKNGSIWQHYADPSITPYSKFYGEQYDSNITFVFNPVVSLNKNFNTLNYEGTVGWKLTDLYSNSDYALPIEQTKQVSTLVDLQDQLFLNNFKRKEDKFFGTIINNTPATYGEIVYGKSMSGIKGFYATAKLSFTNPPENTPGSNYIPNKAQLYSVSTEYVESSY